jgi:hypothetical protein
MPAASNKGWSVARFITPAILGCFTLVHNPAQAFIVTVDQKEYDVKTERINYNNYQSTFISQPWWGNRTLAQQFSNSVAFNLGTISAYGNTSGPIFAYTLNSSVYPVAGVAYNFIYGSTTQSGLGETLDFAVATFIPPVPVPGPVPILAALASLHSSRRIRKRIQSARQVNS